jgi:hypothetical protein
MLEKQVSEYDKPNHFHAFAFGFAGSTCDVNRLLGTMELHESINGGQYGLDFK